MALKLPPEGHPVRALIVREDVPTTDTAYRLLPTIDEARRDARERFKADRRRPGFSCTGPSFLLIHTLVRHEDGRVLLMSFGPKGGYKTRWNLGRWSSEPPKIHGLTASQVIIDDPHAPFRCRWPSCGCDPTKLRGMKAHPCPENDRKCKNVT